MILGKTCKRFLGWSFSLKPGCNPFEYKRKAKIAELINYITQASPNPIELSEKALSLTYSVICQIAFNKNYDEIDGSKFKAFVQESMELFGTVATSDIIPGFGRIVDALTGLPRRIEYCHRRFDSFFEKLIEEHLDPTKQKSEQDVIDVMLSLSNDEKAQFNPTKEHIKAVLMVSHGSCFPLFFFPFYGMLSSTEHLIGFRPLKRVFKFS